MEGLIMILGVEDLATKAFILKAKDTFEDMAKCVIRTTNPKKYTMLKYEEILEKMGKYIESYVDYKKTGDEKYRGKVLITTKTFFDNMFIEENKYRTKLTLKQISKTSEPFLKATKEFQSIMEKYIEKQDQDYELQQMLIMANNQYKKLSRVYHDDMKIYMWLATKDSSIAPTYKIPAELRTAFYNVSAPVIHPVGLKKNGVIDFDDKIDDDDDSVIDDTDDNDNEE